MTQLSDFRGISNVPSSLDEVVWFDLAADLHAECAQALEDLTEACRATSGHKTTFFVGAGISIFRPSWVPAAKDVLSMIFEQCELRCSTSEKSHVDVILQVIRGGHYVLMENVLQQLYQIVHPRPFHTGQIFDVPGSPPSHNVNHAFLAEWLRSNRGTVITTNLDPLIEHAWRTLGSTASALSVKKRPDEFDDWPVWVDKPNVLWKLHGSVDDDESWAITLSKVGFEIIDARASLIEHLVTHHNLCFVGYRGADVDIFPCILRSHLRRRGTRNKIFWVLLADDRYKTLGEYLAHEPNIRQLFNVNRDHIHPIITTAERLFTWLQVQCIGNSPIIPPSDVGKQAYNFGHWLEKDIETIGRYGVTKLIGTTLRTIGRHEDSHRVLDEAAESIMQTSTSRKLSREEARLAAQLLEESAHTLFQKGEVGDARARLGRALRLWNDAGDALGKAWCRYGMVTLAITGKKGVRVIDRVTAMFRLILLSRDFQRISKQLPSETSPIVGKGLCLYYMTRMPHRIGEKLGLVRLGLIRKRLIKRYDEAEKFMRVGESVNTILDVKRARAFLRVHDDPELAVDEMIGAIRLAQVVGKEYSLVTIRRARMLVDLLGHGRAKRQLMDAITEAEKSLIDHPLSS